MALVALDEFTLELIRDSNIYNLSSGSLSYLMDYSGLGLPPAQNFYERAPLQNGNTRRGFRLDPRNFQKTFYVPADCRAKRQRVLSEFLDILSLQDGLLTFRFILPDYTIRLIDFTLESTIDIASGERVSRLDDYGQLVMCQFLAPDPTFYEPTTQVVTFELDPGDAAGFTVPTPVPTSIGADELDDTAVILYAGSANSYPIIRINGPIINPVITNETTDVSIEFVANTEIVLGDWWEIDTKAGTIVDEAGDNQLGSLSADSSLSQFYLLREREAPSGNTITVTGDRVSGATSITFTYYIRHGGLY
jgi:hypothetical protein